MPTLHYTSMTVAKFYILKEVLILIKNKVLVNSRQHNVQIVYRRMSSWQN